MPGRLWALLREDDEHHEACVKQAKQLRRPGYTCWPVLTEAAYLLRNKPTAVSELLSWSDGTDFVILPLDASDLPGIRAVLEKYRDQRIPDCGQLRRPPQVGELTTDAGLWLSHFRGRAKWVVKRHAVSDDRSTRAVTQSPTEASRLVRRPPNAMVWKNGFVQTSSR